MLAVTELGVTAFVRVIDDSKHVTLLAHDKYVLLIFTSAWTVASIFIHWKFSYLVAAIWAGITAALWLASGVLVTLSLCPTRWILYPNGQVSGCNPLGPRCRPEQLGKRKNYHEDHS